MVEEADVRKRNPSRDAEEISENAVTIVDGIWEDNNFSPPTAVGFLSFEINKGGFNKNCLANIQLLSW